MTESALGTWSLRPITDDDLPFLCELYGSTREWELSVVDWTDDQKREFIAFQFHAQHTFYQQHFPQAQFDVIEVDGQRGGRLYVDRRSDEIRLVDIALLPAFRNHGLGSQLLTRLLDEAQARRQPLRIHVEHNNPAMRLYLRLGFVKVEEQGVYHLMERKPSVTGTT